MCLIRRFVVGLFLVMFLSACEDKIKTGDYVERSKGLLSENKLAGALIEAKNALKENAGDFEAHKVLGDIYLKKGNPLLGEVEFRKLEELGADKNIWLPGLLKSYFLQQKFTEILSVKAEGLDKSTEAVVLSYQAQSLLYTGKIKEAGTLFDKLESYNVENNEVDFAKANYLRKINKYDEAKATLLSIISKDSNNYEAYSMLGSLEFQLKNYDLAEAAYSSAYTLNPENKQVLIQRAHLRFVNNEIKLAQDDVNVLLKVYPKASKVNLIQGLILVQQKMDEQASPYLELSVNGPQPPVQGLYALANINLKRGDIEQAAGYSSRLLKIAPSIPSYVLAARVKIHQRMWVEAEKDLMLVLNKTPENIVALNLLASVHLGQGKLSQAVDVFNKVAELAPHSAESSFKLGVTLMAQGNYSKSLEHLQKALGNEPNNTLIESMVAQNYILRKDFNKAEEVVKSLKAKYPNRAFPFVLSSNVFNLRGEKESAKKALKEGCDVEPSDLDSCLNYAKSSLNDKELGESEKAYKSILDSHPKNYMALIKLANISLLRGDKEKMVSILDELISTYPNVMEPKLLKGWHLYGEKKLDSIEPIFADISTAKKMNNMSYLELMASVSIDLQKISSATVFIRKILEVDPKNQKGLFLSAVAKMSDGNVSDAISGFKKVLGAYPNNAMARLMLTKGLLVNSNIAEAKTHLKKLEKVKAMDVEVMKIKSRIAMQSGDMDEAITYAKKAADKAPSEKNIISLGRLLWRNSNKAGAISVLENGKKQYPENLGITFELASFYSLNGDEDEALNNLESILKKSPNHKASLNNAAWILSKRDTKKALVYATRLTDIDPKNAGYLDTLAMVYYHNGDIEQANRSILRAIDIQQKPTYIFHKAVIDDKKGEWLLAIKSLTSILEKDINFPERKKAEELLATLKAGR